MGKEPHATVSCKAPQRSLVRESRPGGKYLKAPQGEGWWKWVERRLATSFTSPSKADDAGRQLLRRGLTDVDDAYAVVSSDAVREALVEFCDLIETDSWRDLGGCYVRACRALGREATLERQTVEATRPAPAVGGPVESTHQTTEDYPKDSE